MNSIPITFKQVPDMLSLKNQFPSLRGLFFDMDGTLFNTENIHALALTEMAHKHQIKPPYPKEQLIPLMMGKADHILFEIMKNWDGVPVNWRTEDFIEEKNSIMIKFLSSTPVESFFSRELAKLLKDAEESEYFLGLITSSEKIITHELLKISGLSEVFNLILTRDDCPKHKPDPWPYLKAKEMSGLKSQEILIFEDSEVGLEAAIQSGPQVIKVEWY